QEREVRARVAALGVATTSGIVRHRFRQEQSLPTSIANGVRASATNILTDFDFEQGATTVRVVDADGSIYQGNWVSSISRVARDGEADQPAKGTLPPGEFRGDSLA